MATITRTPAQIAARHLLAAAHDRDMYLDMAETPAARALWESANREMANYRETVAALPEPDRLSIEANLYHLQRAAMAGDTAAADRAYDAAKAAGVFK